MLEIGPYIGGKPRFEMEYDVLGMQTRFISRQVGPEADYRYLYGPGDHRLVTFDTGTGERVFKLRGLSDEVLQEYSVTGWGSAGGGSPGEGWVHQKDLLYGPEGVFATRNRTGSEVRFLHKDHLGTSRLLTDHLGNTVGRHDYYPFGLEAPRTGQADEPTKKYTGHERDPHGLGDYMLGRTCLYPFMRFATPDPARDGWSLYAYTGNNPVNYTDPDGHESRAEVMFQQDADAYFAGDITAEEFSESLNARGQGALLGLTILSPVDEISVAGVLVEAGVTTAGRLRIVGRIGAAIKKLLGKSDEVVDNSTSASRRLPRTRHGDPIPDTDVPHSQLGQGRDGTPQAREWVTDSEGRLVPSRDIDFGDHGFPETHPNPHQHLLTPNNPATAPRGGMKRGQPEPLEYPG